MVDFGHTWTIDFGAQSSGTPPWMVLYHNHVEGPIEQIYVLGYYADTVSSPLVRVELTSTNGIPLVTNAITSTAGTDLGGHVIHLTIPNGSASQVYQEFASPRPLLHEMPGQKRMRVVSLHARVTDFSGNNVTFTRLVLHLGMRGRESITGGQHNYSDRAQQLMSEF